MRIILTIGLLFVFSAGAAAQGPSPYLLVRTFWRADTNESRLLATPAPEKAAWHHTNQAPALGNGRVWNQSVVTREPVASAAGGERGAEHFGGAAADRGTLIFVKVGTEVVATSPWARGGTEGFQRLDLARSVWLREHGFAGGVRTFTNPSRVVGSESARPASNESETITPAGFFRTPADMPRTKKVEQVRYSIPPGMNPVLAARLQSQTASDGSRIAARE